MKFQRITIENFQSYYGEKKLDFGEGLNLIIGNNGKGKSTLFNAFYWCLFGKIYISSGWYATDEFPKEIGNTTMQKYGFVNSTSLHDANPGDTIRCAVCLDLLDDRGQQYLVERGFSVTRTAENEWNRVASWNVSPCILKVTVDTPMGTQSLNGALAESKIGELFPIDIRDYIWFQGEALDALIDFKDPKNLEKAVKHISYFPYYEKMTKIVSEALTKISSKETRSLQTANRNNSQAKNLYKHLQDLQNKLTSETTYKENIQSRISQLQGALDAEQLKMNGLAQYASLVKAYDDCTLEIKDINNEMTNWDNKERELLSSLWILRGADKLISESKTIMDSYVKEVFTIPEKKYIDNPSRTKLEEILNVDHKCFVCGAPVDTEHPERIEWINNRLQMQKEYLQEMEDYQANMAESKKFDMLVGKINDYPDNILASISNIDKQYKDIEDRIQALVAKRNTIVNKRKGIDQQISAISTQHGITDLRKQAGLYNTINSGIGTLRTDLDRENKKLDASNRTIGNLQSQIDSIKSNLTQMGAAYTGAIVTTVPETEWKNISKELADICTKVRDKAHIDLLQKIVDRANQYYRLFTQHDRGYKGIIEIDNEFNIRFDPALNKSHEDRKKMSVINALLTLNQEALGISYPFINDAPTSDFDSQTAHYYYMGIKDIFGQTIIMTKDVEIGSPNYNQLFHDMKVSHIYQLSSKFYCGTGHEPEQFEVSTEVKRLK